MKYSGDWFWLKESTPYTVELTSAASRAVLSVGGLGSTTGTATYEGPYTTLWVGNSGNGDWPECAGIIERMVVEPLE